ncbi:MAG: TPM domain-containing protein, partial [Gammaproteobacteria bacterium]|nr:TPM domain-containing protein [Gammaproteobacteria bacterium]
MKNFKHLILLFLSFTFVFADNFINVQDYVHDNANILSSETKEILKTKLQSLDATDSTQLVVVTIDSLEGQPIETVSFNIAQKNGIGSKTHNNGVLYLVCVKDREIRIEVGKGLESRLTDMRAGEIIDKIIVPHYANNNFDEGTLAGVDSIITTIHGEYGASQSTSGSDLNLVYILSVSGLMLLWIYDSTIHNEQLALPDDRRKKKNKFLGFAPWVRASYAILLGFILGHASLGLIPSVIPMTALYTYSFAIGVTLLCVILARSVIEKLYISNYA